MNWIYASPPILGQKEMKWYNILLDDSTIGKACWWHDHWYCCSVWDRIVAYSEI